MRKITFILSLFLLASCSKKSIPQVQFIDTKITNYDTSIVESNGIMDTIYSRTPCDSFLMHVMGKDTVYIKEYKTKIVTETIVRIDTVYRQPIVTTPQPKKSVVRNSYNEETKLKNSMQIKDATIGTLQLENIALRGKLKQSNDSITKMKVKGQSVIGSGQGGNRNKGSSWWWIFFAGFVSALLVVYVGIPLAKRYIPFGNILSKIRFNR